MPGQRSYDLADFAILNSKLGITQQYSTGTNIGGWLMVFNETPYQVKFEFGSARYLNMLAQTVDIIEIFQGDGVAFITAKQYLNVQNPPSATIKVKYFTYKPEGTFPTSYTRQAVTSDPSGSIGFSAFVIITNASQLNGCGLNIFNPANSGVVIRLFSAIIMPFGLSVVTANAAIRTDGTDNNFSLAIGSTAHNIGKPGSVAHVTAFQNTIIGGANIFVGTWNLYDKAMDAVISVTGGLSNAWQIYPGQNFLINIQNPEINSIPSFSFQWSDQP